MEIYIYNDQEAVCLDIDNETLSLEDLQIFFPSAVGLRYRLKDKLYIVPQHANLLSINADVTEYSVYTEEDIQNDRDLFVRVEVRKYFYKRYTYKEMIRMLKKCSNIQISLRNLKRLLKEMNLKRKSVIESPVGLLRTAILQELDGQGADIGYRPMWQRLRGEYFLDVKQQTVLEIMRELDPLGIERRSRYRLKRRIYKVLGPNHMWHIDGFDKLKRWGFAIHGCVDGCSRKVIWLEVATTNNDPRVVAYYFLEGICEHECVPIILRSDRGTENQLVEVIQRVLRNEHADPDAQHYCFIKGKSVHNERIEKYWKQLRNSTLGFYIDLFRAMEETKVLDQSDIVQVELLRYCFGKTIQNDLRQSTKEWNEHRIRLQKDIEAPCGIPNMIYHCPEHFDLVDCRKPVNLNIIPEFKERVTTKPKIYHRYTEDLVQFLIPDASPPNTPRDACNLFMKLRELMEAMETS
ncbi:hypothetical protein QAD02_020993 [Eretmocerus hayati]|uniref:Uncharacterized protein n=1 Tax=Eretmocerus hayati TaxID=131215 RepID=A0ACC2PTT4_9HYME|nr:hypothetical protein QAD02_020993 [Eretmocerus hayati]